MTQTSDDCPNNSGGGSSASSSTTTNKVGRTVTLGIANHDKVEDGEKVGNGETSICMATNAPQEQVPQESVVAKVNRAEESTQTLNKGDENSHAPGIFTTGIDTTTTTTVEGIIALANNNVTAEKVVPNEPCAGAAVTTTIANGVVAKMNSSDGIDDTGTTSSSASHTFSKAPMCAVCSDTCICYCKSCKKVSYCSKEHQKLHWKEHRPDCYPVTIQVNSVFGSHLVVTRDIKRGEVILREKPLVSAPFLNFAKRDANDKDNEKNGCSVCLVCHKIIREEGISSSELSYSPSRPISSCSRCKWPICCAECEKNPIHADQECKIFAEYHVEPSALCDKDAQFLAVALLRILQHKSAWDPTSSSAAVTCKWSRFMDVVNKQVPMKDGLNSQLAEAKKATARISALIKKSLGSIIYTDFSVTDAEIDQIVRTLRTSSFITDSKGNYINGFATGFYKSNISNLGHVLGSSNISKNTSRHSNSTSGKFLTLYHLASMLTSNCVPNTLWVIQQPCLDFYLRASTSIKTGERITITFVDPLLGTHDRRELLWKEKYLSCSCTRCSDPTESCTFFSAIKCPGKKVGKEEATAAAASVERPSKNGCDGNSGGVIRECEGYLLPTDPLAVTYTSCHSLPSRCCSATSQVEAGAQEMVRSGGEEDAFLPGEKLCEEKMAEWKCNVCLMRQPWGFVQKSLERMRRIFLAEPQHQENVCFTMNIQHDAGSGATIGTGNKGEPEESKQDENISSSSMLSCNNNLESLEARVDRIDSLVGNVAHANNHYILKMENEILSTISELLEKGQVPFEQMEKWAVRMIELCKKGLKVVNILCPGLSRERGRLLYFLQLGLTISLLFKTSRAMRARVIMNPSSDQPMSSSKSVNNNNKEVLSHEELMKKFYEVILARKELLEIFALTKDNSREREMLKAVQQDSIEVRLLKNYFKTHQNVSPYRI